MADLVLCEKQDIVNIANAVRAKTNTTNQMSFGEMSMAIRNISSTSASVGYITVSDVNSLPATAPDGTIAVIVG